MIPWTTFKIKLIRWTMRLKSSYKKQMLKYLNYMRIWTKCMMWAKKSLSMSWNWWHGNKIVVVWKRLYKRKSIVLKLSRPEWNEKWKHSSKMNWNYKSRQLSKMHSVTSKVSREAFTSRIKHSQRRQWARDIYLTSTSVRRQRCLLRLRNKNVALLYNKMPLKNMRRGVWISRRRSRS